MGPKARPNWTPKGSNVGSEWDTIMDCKRIQRRIQILKICTQGMPTLDPNPTMDKKESNKRTIKASVLDLRVLDFRIEAACQRTLIASLLLYIELSFHHFPNQQNWPLNRCFSNWFRRKLSEQSRHCDARYTMGHHGRYRATDAQLQRQSKYQYCILTSSLNLQWQWMHVWRKYSASPSLVRILLFRALEPDLPHPPFFALRAVEIQ